MKCLDYNISTQAILHFISFCKINEYSAYCPHPDTMAALKHCCSILTPNKFLQLNYSEYYTATSWCTVNEYSKLALALFTVPVQLCPCIKIHLSKAFRTATHSTKEKPTHQQNIDQTHNRCIQQNNHGII
jgi:hypothetical protein